MSHTAPAAVPSHRQPVTISVVDGQIRVDPEHFVISKGSHQDVIWVASDSNLHFTVEFKNGDSPFYETHFNKDFPASGLARRSVPGDEKRRYKYWVTVDGVTEPLDPTGVITK
jgi:hypothetical protein